MATIKTQIHLQGVHNRLLNKVRSKATAEKDADAKRLEYYLNLIKNPREGEDPIWQQLRADIVKTRGGRKVSNLFHSTGSTGGFAFEEEIGSLMQVLVNYMTGQDVSNKKHRVYWKDAETGKNHWKNEFQLNIDVMTGNTQASPRFNQIFNGVEQELIQSLVSNGKNAKVPASIVKENYEKYYKLIDGPKFGKPDIVGKNMIGTDVFWDTTTEFGELLALLNKYSFTLKNYSSIGSMWNDIQLGSTDPYKAYYSVLSSLGYGGKYIYDSYFRARNCYRSISINTAHGEHGVSLHMAHIQNIYELIGMGMAFLDGSEAEADMLILNNSADGNIFVRSTASMAKDFLETNGSYYGMKVSKKNPFEAHSSSIKGSSKSFGIKHTPIKINKKKKKT